MEPTPLQMAVEEWLADGPLPVDELADRAVEAGLVPAGMEDQDTLDAIYELLDRSDAYWTVSSGSPDEVMVLAATFVDTGMTFTHRVDEDELETGTLAFAPDLSVVDWDARDGLLLDDGGGRVVVHHSEPGASHLAGPPGWLEGARPGDLLALSRTDRGLSVDIVDEADLAGGDAEIEALGEAAERWIGGGRGEEEVPVVMEAMARDPQLFRHPVPPLGELLEAAGLERRGHEWGRADEEWRTRQELFQKRDDLIRKRYELDPCCNQALDRVEEVWHEHLRGTPIDGRALAEDLGHGVVAPAFAATHTTSPELIVGFARTAADTTGGRHAAPALTLLGLAHLRAGHPEAAYEALGTAIRSDPSLTVAAETLATLELDRGDLSRAHTLVVQGGADPHLVDWIETERTRQAVLRPSAGRNDPCPCGSGRKFKKCCAKGGALTLGQRVPLLLGRIAHYATGPERHETLFGLVLSAAGRHEDLVEAIHRFAGHPFLVDVAVHEGGLGHEYLDERGPLLADDERELLETVFDEPRRLWEITDLTPGRSMTLRDTGSGDELTVVEHSASEDRETGELLLGRVATVDGRPILIDNAILVPLRERSRVLRMLDGWVDADTLAMWFGSLFLPPRVTNREGEDVVLRRTTIGIPSDVDAVGALDRTYERSDEERVWHETTVVDHDESVIRGMLRLDGDELIVESNSEERQQRILTTIAELFPFVVVDDEEIDDLDPHDADDEGPDLFDDPENIPEDVRVLVEEQIAEYEDRWVDESIPALGGLTPRQARDDPTRREDLFALLREMRALDLPDEGLGMSVDRLERLLGIERG